MALLKELKGVNLSCSNSAASTSAAVEEQYPSMLVSLGSSGRAIDRFSPHIRDPMRAKSLISLNHEELTRSSPATTNTSNSSPKKAPMQYQQQQQQQQQLISPASSSRYLLSGSGSGSASDDLWDSTPQAPESVVSEAWRFRSPKVLVQSASTVIEAAEIEPSTQLQSIKLEELQSATPPPLDDPEYSSSSTSSSTSSPSSSSSNTRPQNHQVVVLRVSLHCKGCEAKVRKHISKMEGVTSFTTDLVNKKVTVIGDVTPLGVLNSISKVKNAQLWRSLPPTSSPSTKNLS